MQQNATIPSSNPYSHFRMPEAGICKTIQKDPREAL